MSKNLSPKYYPENKERLLEKARERYQNHSKEEKENMVVKVTEDEKNKLIEYRKKYYKMIKNVIMT